MFRNRSVEPTKSNEQMIPMSTVQSIIQSLQAKVVVLEKKYLEFVEHSTKVIRDAQSFLDQSINDHVLNPYRPSSKIIENLTQQKQKLRDDLIGIEKMSKDFDNKNDKLGMTLNIMRNITKAKEKILEKINENKLKYYVQGILLTLEEKIHDIITKIDFHEQNKDKISELENLLKIKEKDFEGLQQYAIKLKSENERNINSIGYATDYKSIKRLGSPDLSPRVLSRKFSGSNLNKPHSQKDAEIFRLKNEISYLQEKFIGLTGKAQKLVIKKENELSKYIIEVSKINEIKNLLKSTFRIFYNFEEKVVQGLDNFSKKISVFRLFSIKFQGLKNVKPWSRVIKTDDKVNLVNGLEKIIEDLKLELNKKEETVKTYTEEISQYSKAYSEANEKNQNMKKKIEEIQANLTEKVKDIDVLYKKNIELTNENKKLSGYKNELDLEIMDLKEYFQTDIDNLSNKIENLFSENLFLKQKNEEIKEKYEKVMTEKEKMMVDMYENSHRTISTEYNSPRSDSYKISNNSELALKQELKIASQRLNSQKKELSKILENLETVVKFIHFGYQKITEKVLSKTDLYAVKLETILKALRESKNKKQALMYADEQFLDFRNKNNEPQSIERLQKNFEKIQNFKKKSKLSSEKQVLKSNQNLIENLNQSYKKVMSDSNLSQTCSKCEILDKIIQEKDEIIISLQKVITNLENENNTLGKEIQNIEFTFQNFIQDSKSQIKEEEDKSKKSQKVMISSTDLIKTFDSKSFEGTISDVDLTYTIEGTTIKSLQEITLISSSGDEAQDLEVV
jgi:predicted RNase H-like nuclease